MDKARAVAKVAGAHPTITWDAASVYPVDDGQVFVVFSKGDPKHCCLVDAGGCDLYRQLEVRAC